ncbi:MAG TPA: GxxExxY protein, partial [Chryseosolibacter sp.]|nr:GxxExxY protein [Chryseosolibacter sp.]
FYRSRGICFDGAMFSPDTSRASIMALLNLKCLIADYADYRITRIWVVWACPRCLRAGPAPRGRAIRYKSGHLTCHALRAFHFYRSRGICFDGAMFSPDTSRASIMALLNLKCLIADYADYRITRIKGLRGFGLYGFQGCVNCFKLFDWRVHELQHKEITEKIIGCAFEVHKYLGNGFQEVIYQRALAYEFVRAGIGFEREIECDIFYKDRITAIGRRRADFVVEGTVLVELKAVVALEPVHHAQILNYLKAYNLQVGLLLNFGTKSLQLRRQVLTPKINEKQSAKSHNPRNPRL